MKAQQALNRAEGRHAAQAIGRDARQPRWFEKNLVTENMAARIANLPPSNGDVMMVDAATGKLFVVTDYSDPAGPDVPRP